MVNIKKKGTKLVLVYSGFNTRAIIAFLRVAILRNVSFAIIAKSDNDDIFHTDYSHNVVYTRRSLTLDVVEILSHVEIARKKLNAEDVLILPSTEYLNRILLSNKELLFNNHVSFGLCEKKLYEKLSDKETFTKLCYKNNVPIPIGSHIPLSTFPQVAKPKAYFKGNKIGEKPRIIKSPDELKIFESNINIDDYFYQNYIGGNCVYLLFYFSRNGSYSIYSQENYIQQSKGASMILAKSSNYHNNQAIVKPYVNMFLSEKFVGLVMVEIKIQNGIPYMIEANPRLWGPSQLILDANMNLFDCFMLDNGILTEPIIEQKYQENVYYFWSGGMLETQKKNEQIRFYNYRHRDFVNNYYEIIKNEIFLKKDTINIFLKENL